MTLESTPVKDWDSVPEKLQHFKGAPTGMSIGQDIVDWYVSLDSDRQEKLLFELNKSNQICREVNRDQSEGIKRTWNKQAYDPSKEYYFMDYYDQEDFRWVRNPMMTLEDIQTQLRYMDEVQIKELRIQPESFLSRLHENVGDDIAVDSQCACINR